MATNSGGLWPSRDDYQSAVLYPTRNLKDARLHSTVVESRPIGALKAPYPRSGNFGAVYKFSNGRQAYAVKVFDKGQPDRQQRYLLIDQHLKRQPPSPNLVSFGYDGEGIKVSGRWYPVLTMDWVEGETLDRFLAGRFSRNGQVDNRSLCQAWSNLILGLSQRRLGHGDLQHGNILVVPDGTLKLVDYDGMFVPAMRSAGLTAAEIGLPAYQHPKRYRGYFDERLDHFSALVILLCLASVTEQRWARYHNDDNCLIVSESDLLRPEQSALLAELSNCPDAPLKKLAVLLKAAAKGGLDQIPPFENVIADSTVKLLLAPSWRPTPGPRPERSKQKTVDAGFVPAPPPKIQPREAKPLTLPPSLDVQPTNKTVTSASTSSSAGTKKGSGWIVFLIIAVVIGWFIYRANQNTASNSANVNAQAAATPAPEQPQDSGGAPALGSRSEQVEQPQQAEQPQQLSQPDPPPTAPVAINYIQNVSLEYNRVFSGTNGILIHCDCQISQADTRQAWIAAFFWYSNGAAMPAQLPDYRSPQGQAYVSQVLDVTYAPATRYNDLTLYIPYAALVPGQGHFATIEIQDRATGRSLTTARTGSFYIQ